MTEDVVIIGGVRTPMGGLMGELSAVSAVELGATAIKAALERSGIAAEYVDEVIMGCVLQAANKPAPARQAALAAGIPASAGAATVNKLCASGMQALIYGHDQIKAGSASTVVAGGMESMSNAPHILPKARGGVGTGAAPLYDHMFLDALHDAYTGKAMGEFAQITADKHKLTRSGMDEFAMMSLSRAKLAIEDGSLAKEIVPITVNTRKGETVVCHDEQPIKGNLDRIPTLRPAFTQNGTITAANSSSISDGASALVLMSAIAAQQHGIIPLARIVGHARHSREPEAFTEAPIDALAKLLKKVGWNKDEVDLWEINEAFAMVTMLAMHELHLDPRKVNIHGGACAQGHPIGSTGARLVVTLMHALQQYGLKKGVAGLCIGGGEALAVAIELT